MNPWMHVESNYHPDLLFIQSNQLNDYYKIVILSIGICLKMFSKIDDENPTHMQL